MVAVVKTAHQSAQWEGWYNAVRSLNQDNLEPGKN